MKVMAIREVKQTLSGCVAQAQHDHVLITQHGKPAALLIGVRGYDMEDLILMRDAKFWELIQARRKETTSYSLDEVREHLGHPKKEKKERAARPAKPAPPPKGAAPPQGSGRSPRKRAKPPTRAAAAGVRARHGALS
jgi:prevent-host-death family protein